MSVRESFAGLGGDEAASRRVAEILKRETGTEDAVATPGESATVEAIAAALKQRSEALRQRGHGFWARNVDGVPGAGRPPFFFLHGGRHGGVGWLATLARLGPDQPVFGIAPHVNTGEPIPPTVEAMAASHLQTIREIEPAGPYLLGGFCNGGVVAFEAAHQLVAAGAVVRGVVLVAPFLPGTYRYGVRGLVVNRVLPRVDRAQWLVFRVHRRVRHTLGLAPPVRPLDFIRERGDEAWRYTAVLGAYRLRPLPAPVVIVWPARERRRFRVPSDRAWLRLQPGAVRAAVPGTHMGCSSQEHAAETAARLRESIDALLAPGLSRSFP